MTRGHHVLLYGTGPLIQEAKWILQFFDLSVSLLERLSDPGQVPGTTPIDLLILWDSTSPEECEAVMSSISRQWPASKSLVLPASAAVRATTLLSQVSHVLKV